MATERLRPAEAPASSESAVLDRLITPDTALLLGGAFEPALTRPDTLFDASKTEAFTSFLTTLTPDALSFDDIERVSLQSRTEYWQQSTKDFAAQNKEWNDATWKWMKAQVRDDAALKDDAKAAFSSLGVSIDNDEKTGELQTEVETFRQTYFGEKSDVKKFVSDIAQGCMENGQVNLVMLEKRLTAVEGLFNAFGETYHIPTLIKECTVTHSLLTQPAEKKAALAPRLIAYLTVPLPQAQAFYLRKNIPPPIIPRDRSVTSSTTRTSESRGQSDDEAVEGYSPTRREDDEEDEGEHDHDDDRTTYGRAGDNDPTTRGSSSGDSDPTTTGSHVGDSDRSTNEAEYVPGDSDSDSHDSDMDSDSSSEGTSDSGGGSGSDSDGEGDSE